MVECANSDYNDVAMYVNNCVTRDQTKGIMKVL